MHCFFKSQIGIPYFFTLYICLNLFLTYDFLLFFLTIYSCIILEIPNHHLCPMAKIFWNTPFLCVFTMLLPFFCAALFKFISLFFSLVIFKQETSQVQFLSLYKVHIFAFNFGLFVTHMTIEFHSENLLPENKQFSALFLTKYFFKSGWFFWFVFNW